jgi:hypothetical protein
MVSTTSSTRPERIGLPIAGEKLLICFAVTCGGYSTSPAARSNSSPSRSASSAT